MCLISLHRFQLTFKPIKVYKVVVEIDGQLYSPYQATHVTKIMCGNFLKTPKTLGSSCYSFDEGFIHAFLNKESAAVRKQVFEIEQLSIGTFYQCMFKIIEGYIPPFTRYAIDKENTECCARIMIFNL